MSQPKPTEFDVSEVLACARYGDEGDLDDIKTFVANFGAQALAGARDESGNTALHMAGGNGHLDIFTYLVSILPPTSHTTPNSSLSTPLHWIALNFHLPLLHLLCPLLPPPAFLQLNNKHKTPLQLAEEATEAFAVPEDDDKLGGARTKERVKRERVVGYLLQCMGLGVGKRESGKELVGDEGEGEGETGGVEGVREKVEKVKLGDRESAKEVLASVETAKP